MLSLGTQHVEDVESVLSWGLGFRSESLGTQHFPTKRERRYISLDERVLRALFLIRALRKEESTINTERRLLVVRLFGQSRRFCRRRRIILSLLLLFDDVDTREDDGACIVVFPPTTFTTHESDDFEEVVHFETCDGNTTTTARMRL